MNSGETKQLAVIGNPISHSASPKMQGAMIADLNLNMSYNAILIETPDALRVFCDSVRDDANFIGFNVTIPYKEVVMPFLDELAPSALRAQAVNTVVNKGGRLVGHNTDGDGYVLALTSECQFKLKGSSAVLIGAGGAAKGIAVALMENGLKQLTIVNRTLSKAEGLSQHLLTLGYTTTALALAYADQALSNAGLVINTTPIGMADTVHHTPLPVTNWCHSGQLVSDIIYKPAQTEFLKQAAAKGAKTYGGAGMLAGQGAIAFKLFTGKNAQFDIMRATL
ncbi:MAG: shikimate dehydrogenase [bacterium]|nr:shikimate dehydrogenase [bacterium]